MADFSADSRKVEFVPHDPSWAQQAVGEIARIAAAIGDTLASIEHIGSTSIPGILAKPTIDLMPVVRDLAILDTRRPHIEALGYLWRGEWGFAGRRYCVRDKDGKRAFHVHCYEAGHPEIARSLTFRDYLRANRDEALGYEAIKREAAAAQPDDSLKYNAHKSAWIRACQQRADAWAAR